MATVKEYVDPCLEELRAKVNFINIYEQLLCRYCFAKKLQSQTVIREKLCKTLSYKKTCKMLMKLTPCRR